VFLFPDHLPFAAHHLANRPTIIKKGNTNMNTLNKTITSSFFVSPEGYAELQRRWSQIVNSEEKHNLTPAHYLLYAVLRGKDWRKGFVTPKRQDPSWQGATPVAAYHALGTVRHLSLSIGSRSSFAAFWTTHFGDILNAQGLEALRELLPSGYSTNALEADAYANLKSEVAA
jgi:hypothetical protein